VVEQVFHEQGAAEQMAAALNEMGYAVVVDQRRGDELPAG